MAVLASWPHLTPCGGALALRQHVWRAPGALGAVIPEHVVRGAVVHDPVLTWVRAGCLATLAQQQPLPSLMGEAADPGGCP